MSEVRGLDNVIRLTQHIWNENYGRNVQQWCSAVDEEEILQEELDNEDDMDMASDERVPSFLALKDSLL